MPSLRQNVQHDIAAMLTRTTDHTFEVVVASSQRRGAFLSLCAPVDALDAARAILEETGRVVFTERDVDPFEAEQVDYYAFTA